MDNEQEKQTESKPSIWTRIKEWWKTLTREEWEVTIFFPGETKFLPDGTRIDTGAPKTYLAKKLTKVTTTHIIFTDTSGVHHEIKVVNPVGYDIRKIY